MTTYNKESPTLYAAYNHAEHMYSYRFYKVSYTAFGQTTFIALKFVIIKI